MKTTLVLLFLLASFFVRALRWIGVLQQKEYRFDRVALFLLSGEGIRELLRILPKKSDFSKTGLKRPKMTHRSLLLSAIFALLSFLFLRGGMEFITQFLLQWYPYPLWYRYTAYLLLLVLYLVTIPFLVMLSAVPTVVLAYVQTYKKLLQAKALLDTKKPTVIGITGSYGKTSTKLLLAHVLGKKYSVFVTPKSYNTKYSVAQSVVSGYNGEEIAIIEYAAYKKGEIKELAKWVKPDMAIITGLAKQHVGLFGSLQEIIKAKAELVASLPQKATVICNVYDEQTRQIVDTGNTKNDAKLIAVGPEFNAVQIENARVNQEGKLQFSWNGQTVRTQLVGVQYKELVHLVITTAMHFKLGTAAILDALESFSPDDKFVLTYALASGVKIIDDGDTSNPKGFSAMITLARSLKANKKVLVTPGIVDLGKDSREIHLELARDAKKVFDVVVFVGEPGKEEFQSYFGAELLTTKEQLQEIISTLDKEDLIVIEGRMPAWAKQYFE
ncbi:MAG: hypothetical protein BroJett025_06560 [Patescibacteria group bacterium]|nr:MAG: hypothetical protein BroJett025_06560 [Patescibacteria group bacterium]